MTPKLLFKERLSSGITELLFVVLTVLFLFLSIWRGIVSGLGGWTVVLLCFFGFFLFYSLNYKWLRIRLTAEALSLRFGLFGWLIAARNIDACFPDDTSLWRIGGAGIHFTPLGGRYRAMFNFLEHPRLVIALKVKKGPVRDIAFSTSRPDELMFLIRDLIARNRAAYQLAEADRGSAGSTQDILDADS